MLTLDLKKGNISEPNRGGDTKDISDHLLHSQWNGNDVRG